MEDGLVKCDSQGCIAVEIQNYSLEPIHYSEDTMLGSIQPVTVAPSLASEHQPNNCSLATCAQIKNVNEASPSRLDNIKGSLCIDDLEISQEQKMQLSQVVEAFEDIFALDQSDLGSTDLVTHSINTADNPPLRQPPRRIPFALRQQVERMVDQMMEDGIVVPSNSPWASPIVLVAKKDGSTRFCVDYRRLNSITKKDVYPLPRIDDTLDSLAHQNFFTTLDLASGYWQVRMDPTSQEKTAFTTHYGLFEFSVMPFGLCNARQPSSISWRLSSLD